MATPGVLECAFCGKSISIRYPFVEALSGALVLGAWLLYGLTPAFPIAAGFALAMVVLFFTDYDHQLLPDAVTLTGLVAGLDRQEPVAGVRSPTRRRADTSDGDSMARGDSPPSSVRR